MALLCDKRQRCGMQAINLNDTNNIQMYDTVILLQSRFIIIIIQPVKHTVTYVVESTKYNLSTHRQKHDSQYCFSLRQTLLMHQSSCLYAMLNRL